MHCLKAGLFCQPFFLIFLFFHASYACVVHFDCRPPSQTPQWLPASGVLPGREMIDRLNQNPEDLDTRIALTAHYIARRNSKRALPLLQSLLRLSPSNPEVWYLYSKYAHNEGDYSRASLYSFRAMMLSRNNSESISFTHGLNLIYAGEAEQALKLLTYTHKFTDQTPFHWLRSMALLQLNAWDQAMHVMIPLREELPGFSPLLINMSKASCRNNDRDGTLFYLRKAALAGYKNLNLIDTDPCLMERAHEAEFTLVLDLITANQSRI